MTSKGPSRSFIVFLRLIAAIGILAFLCWFAGTEALLQTFYTIRFEYIFYLFLLAIVMIWASCLKWQLFIRARGHNVPVSALMRWYTVGYFFNTFLPSYIGGDVARSIHLGHHLANQKDAFIATFLERFTGLLAMSTLGVIFVAVGSKATLGVEMAILLVGFGTALLAAICFSQRIARFCFKLARQFLNLFSLSRFGQKLEHMFDKIERAMRYARGDSKLFINAMLLSFVFHCLTIVNTYIAARAIGWENPSISGLFVVVPLVLLVGMAPITPSGLGIQEGAFLFFLMRIGATRADALSVGLVLRAKVFVIALVGGVLLSIARKKLPGDLVENIADSQVENI